MALSGFEARAGRDDVVRFTPPAERPAALRRARWLLVGAMLCSLVGAASNLELAELAARGIDQLTAQLDAIVDSPRTGPLLEAANEAALATRADSGGDPPPRLSRDDLLRGRDVVRILAVIVTLVALGLFALLIYFPLRYGYLLWTLASGHPQTHRAIRRTAWLQLAIEALRLLAVSWINDETRLIDLPAWPSLAALVAAALVWTLRGRALRDYFSCHGYRRETGAGS